MLWGWDSNPQTPKRTDLQSASFSHLHTLQCGGEDEGRTHKAVTPDSLANCSNTIMGPLQVEEGKGVQPLRGIATDFIVFKTNNLCQLGPSLNLIQ